VLGLDFVNDLDHDELLMSSAWEMTVASGIDPQPSVHLEGPSVVIEPYGSSAKTATIQRVGGLFPGVTYVVRAIVVTTTGNTRTLWSHIRGVAAVT
jgi:hypothetical protein